MGLFKIIIDQKRIFGLDILRALAILYVVIGHGDHLLPKGISFPFSWILFDGVSIFFVLSGYLIGGILIKQVNQREFTTKLLFSFWIRRWFRTLPNYYFILTLALLGNYLFNGSHFNNYPFYRFYLFIQNFNFQTLPLFFPEGWSLSVEEWFYIFFPILFLVLYKLLKKKFKVAILLTSFLLIIFSTGMRIHFFKSLDIDSFIWDINLRKLVITRLDSLMYGVIAAYLHFFYPNAWNKFKIPSFILGLILFVFFKIAGNVDLYEVNSFVNVVLSFSFISLATALIIPFLSTIKTGRGLIFRWTTRISLISYSMYLLNLTIVQFNIIKWLPWTENPEGNWEIYALNYALYWILVIGLSTLTYKYFELPVMRLRDKPFFKKLSR